jgi:hypothetical protein
VAAGLMVARDRLPDPDLWNHIANGAAILTTHRVSDIDHYSFTAGGNLSTEMVFEWLGEVVIASTWRARGLSGLMVLLMVLSALLTVLIYYWAYQRCGNSKAAFAACLLALPLVSAFFTLRPQLIGFCFLVVTLICLESFRQGHHRSLWLLPPLFLVWVNLHGSYILGLFVCGLYGVCGLFSFTWGGMRAVPWTGKERLQLEVAGVLSLLALTVTPYGARTVGFTLHDVLSARLGMANITEYRPLGASGAELQILLILLLPFLLALVVCRPEFRLEEVAFLLVALYEACVHSRLLFLFMVAFIPLGARILARWIPGYEPGKDRPLLNFIFISLIVFGVVKTFPSAAWIRSAIARDYPVQAVAYLRRHPIDVPMLNDYGWGGYLNWRMAGEHKVFIDGRSQLYEDAGVYGDYLRITSVGPETRSLMRKYNLQACLIHRDSPLDTFLTAQPDWHTVYSDKLSAILLRQETPSPIDDQ